ncbi:hypothetical protein [Tsukamurella pseudospumae]|nr:hypothetical protein [Tsukamurella pseudospumae]
MGWNIDMLHIAASGPHASDLVRLGEERRVDPAGDYDERAWAHVSAAGVTVVSRRFFDSDVVEMLAGTRTAVTHLAIGSTGGVYLLEAYRDGSRVRRLIEIDTGEGDEDFGEPLPGEESVDEEYTEDKFFALFSAITGVEDLGFLTNAELTLVESPQLVLDFG